jgi:hypothetical protein
MRMVQRCDGPGFPLKPLAETFHAELYGDIAAESPVVSAENLTHSALAEFCTYPVRSQLKSWRRPCAVGTGKERCFQGIVV